MLLTHVVDLHAGQLTVGKRLLNCKTGVIRMHMYLNDVIIRNADDGITDGGKERLEVGFFLHREVFLQKNNKLGAVTELDVGR